ncbi:unnamed protein product [Darwinula stevensoni]|uniref:C2 domain-containing protein n=1 Tax=Darwinula stevensoni TaxID=69355 RepID=A0A7R9A3G7_9CRUS|nr:unnamed protein product [Darwinula stevensoni]CAG0890653.1 unnamed protein product [Darwinula stevensoni]
MLSAWEKLGLIFLAGLFLSLVFILLACIFGPNCWIRNYIDNKKKRKAYLDSEANGCLKNSSAFNSAYVEDGLIEKGEPHHSRSESGFWSNNSSFNKKSNDSLDMGTPTTSLKETEGKGPGRVLFSVQYVKTEDNEKRGKLQVLIKSGEELASRRYLGGCDPYFELRIDRSRWSFKKESKTTVASFMTKPEKKTRNPIVNQSFSFPISSNDFKNQSLTILAYDKDRFANPTVLGVSTLSLRDVANLADSDVPIDYSLTLRPHQENLGSLEFAVTYLPTAGKVSVVMEKCTDAKWKKVCCSLQDFRPYVKLLLLSKTGRVVSKRKTTCHCGGDEIVFAETLTMDAKPEEVETYTLLLVLAHQDSSASTEKPTRIPIGKAAVGRNVRNTEAALFWLSVLKNPRKSHPMKIALF